MGIGFCYMPGGIFGLIAQETQIPGTGGDVQDEARIFLPLLSLEDKGRRECHFLSFETHSWVRQEASSPPYLRRVNLAMGSSVGAHWKLEGIGYGGQNLPTEFRRAGSP